MILRGLREDRGLSIRAAANMLGTNSTRLDRIEKAGNQKVDPGTVTGWAFVYGASEQVINELNALAMRTRETDANGWENVFTTTPKWFHAFLTLEKEAIAIDCYEAAFIPGLLQIQPYMEALFDAEPSLTTAAAAEAVRMKRMRQDWVFDRPHGKLARMHFVLDEACLLRIRKAPYYEEQLHRLEELAKLDAVEISVLPIDRGVHPSMPGAFKLMSFDGPYAPELLYLESVYGGRYIDERQGVARAREVFSDTLTYVMCIEEYLSNVEP
ncbi:helix-turn-helix domain-containing protein [Glycomyces salinus]|uniref:helix-turn-helix domain-containing protein n=1 Tax=Glycomyces salinus TaxID=980294 RepID=UPI0018EABAD6|nr:helix-turn-helix transcriptional regulator [Glycomyces salinus]